MDENKVVELSDGTVMLNSRDSKGSGFRKVTYSTDGGQTYGPVTIDRQLPDPANNADIRWAFPNAAQGTEDAKVLLFSNAASTSGRVNGTIRMSCDEGKTWPIAKVFEPGGMAYSTMATQKDGSIGLLYEPNSGNSGIAYANFNLAWLGELCAQIQADDVNLGLGETVEFPVTITNQTGSAITGGVLKFEGNPLWEITAPAVPDVPAGEKVEVLVTATVPESASPGNSGVPVSLVSDQGTSNNTVNFHVSPPEGVILTVNPEHTNPKALDEYVVGDRLEFSFEVTSFHDTTAAVIPSGDLQGFDPNNGAPNCRYQSLGAMGKYTCDSAFHIVTAEDLEAGEFSVPTSWEVRAGGPSGDSLGTLKVQSPLVKFVEPTEPTDPPEKPEPKPEPTEKPEPKPGPTETAATGATGVVTGALLAVTLVGLGVGLLMRRRQAGH